MAKKSKSGNIKKGLMRLALMVAIAGIAGGGGAVAARFFGGPDQAQGADKGDKSPEMPTLTSPLEGDFEYYTDFETIKVNLLDKRMARNAYPFRSEAHNML